MAKGYHFLKIDNIEGESEDKLHRNEIDVESYGWASEHEGTNQQGGGAGSGKVKMGDFHVVIHTSKATPKLLLAHANGEHLNKVVLTSVKMGKDPIDYVKYTFTHVLISNFHTGTGGSATGDHNISRDQLTLNFATIQLEYRPQKSDGTAGPAVPAGWNVKENTKL